MPSTKTSSSSVCQVMVSRPSTVSVLMCTQPVLEGAAEFFSHRLPVSVCHLWSPRTIWHTHWYQFRCRIYASCFASEHGLVFREFWPFSSEDPILAPKPGNLSLWLHIWHTAWPLVALSVKKRERVFRTAFYNRINLEMLYQLATVPPAPT